MVSPDPGPSPRWLGDLAQVCLAALLAVVLVPLAVDAVTEGGLSPGWSAALLAALVTLHAVVAGAHRWPVQCFAGGAAAMLVLALAPSLGGPTAVEAGGPFVPLLLPSSVCFFVLLYAVAARTAPPWPGAALGAGLAGCLVAVVRLWDMEVQGVVSGWAERLFVAAAVLAGTAAAWALGRYRASRVEWVAAQAQRGAAEERRRIAREMHDVVAHSLAVVVSHAEGGRMLVVDHPERAPEVLGTIAATGREALTQMRGLLGVLGGDGAPVAPQPSLAELPGLVEQVRLAGRTVTLAEEGARRPLGAASELAAYRVVQEALTNVVRHTAPRASATVSLRWRDDALLVRVDDDGGAPSRTVPSVGGRGLTGMRERMAVVGGELTSGPGPHGWRVEARIPHD